MNARSLYNFFSKRCCNRAQWEIRELADLMLVECEKVAPILFSNCGAPCATTGKCPEGKMSCGTPKTKKNKFNLKKEEKYGFIKTIRK